MLPKLKFPNAVWENEIHEYDVTERRGAISAVSKDYGCAILYHRRLSYEMCLQLLLDPCKLPRGSSLLREGPINEFYVCLAA